MVSWLNGSSGACRCHEERVNWKLLEMIFVEQLMFHIPKRLGDPHGPHAGLRDVLSHPTKVFSSSLQYFWMSMTFGEW